MKEFKGTPGPWGAGCADFHNDIIIFNDDGSHVATAESKTGDGYEWSPETVQDNANLIAAAPKLLKALMDITAGYEDYSEYGFFDLHCYGELIGNAMSAINEALGGD